MNIAVNDIVTWARPAKNTSEWFRDEGTVIDADPNATMVSVQVADEPFFRRIPAWMLCKIK